MITLSNLAIRHFAICWVMIATKLKPIFFFVAIHKDAPLPPPCDNYFALGLGGYRPTAIRSYFPMKPEKRSHPETNTIVSLPVGTGFGKMRDAAIQDCVTIEDTFSSVLKGSHFLDGKKYFEPTPEYFRYLTAPERTAFVEKTLAHYDVIVPQRITLGEPLSQHYASYHVREDWDLLSRN